MILKSFIENFSKETTLGYFFLPPNRLTGMTICPGYVRLIGLMGNWQRFPLNIDGHRHEHWHFVRFINRVPLFWHIVNEHWSNGVSHRDPSLTENWFLLNKMKFLPVNPHGHWHWREFFSIEQIPPLKQLSFIQWGILQSDPKKTKIEVLVY